MGACSHLSDDAVRLHPPIDQDDDCRSAESLPLEFTVTVRSNPVSSASRCNCVAFNAIAVEARSRIPRWAAKGCTPGVLSTGGHLSSEARYQRALGLVGIVDCPKARARGVTSMKKVGNPPQVRRQSPVYL